MNKRQPLLFIVKVEALGLFQILLPTPAASPLFQEGLLHKSAQSF
jgi:hypothetical protein